MEINLEELEDMYYRLQELLYPRPKAPAPIIVETSPNLDNIETSCTPSE